MKAFSTRLRDAETPVGHAPTAPYELRTIPPPSAEAMESLSLQREGLLVAEPESGIWRVSRDSIRPGTVERPDAHLQTVAELEESLEDTRRRCAALEAALGEREASMAVLAHELRGPMSAILGWTRLLRHPRTGATQRERALAVIEQSALMQRGLVEDLMDASRLATCRVEVEKAPVDLCELVGWVVDGSRPKAEERRIKLAGELVDRCVVRGDARRLMQVTTNLLNNALKFTPPGGRVTVGVSVGDGVARLTVADTGVGVAPAQMSKIFERFHQGTRSKDRAGGLGLGLFLVKRIVEMHGGAVLCESPGEGRGAIFTVTLPLATAEEADCHQGRAG